jgi:hypothetical protein
MQRQSQVARFFDVNELDHAVVFPTPRGVGARVTLEPVDALASTSLDVRIRIGTQEVAFASPKALTNAARSVQISESEMVGAEAIVVRVGTLAGGSARVLAHVHFTIDQDEGV